MSSCPRFSLWLRLNLADGFRIDRVTHRAIRYFRIIGICVFIEHAHGYSNAIKYNLIIWHDFLCSALNGRKFWFLLYIRNNFVSEWLGFFELLQYFFEFRFSLVKFKIAAKNWFLHKGTVQFIFLAETAVVRSLRFPLLLTGKDNWNF